MPSAIDSLLSVQPLLAGVASAGEALGLAARTMLHAGPPLRDPQRPPPVVLSSAVIAILHEGLAANEQDAEALVRAGGVTLTPAQEHGCVLPLAFVASARTPLFAVEAQGRRMYAPVSTVRGPDTRMGSREQGLRERLLARDELIAPAWRCLLAQHGPVPLLPLAARALQEGDDLHSRTTAATAALAAGVRQHAGALADALDATPLFFLTLWMAASALILRAAEGGDLPTLVTRAGGNGERFGIALAGAPREWICADAQPPSGTLLRPAPAGVAGAIGDSAVIDMLGCGGLALDSAPEPLQAFAGHLPADHARLAGRLLAAWHPVLERPVAVDARRVCAEAAAPLVALAMLGADGATGFVGRGLYRPPLELFARAVAGLA
ncbi:DUF1116 domain-containing protein [Ramlibacter sp.]|uniref:oxamate carbamoyltransferase subunit AllG family protein n=1 Tax=Ramlibacter sp. TaxID=1917967 RepID=UPI002623ED23|nr:DUF1116 domain-containing protein [Ramlibacter sp.]MDB5956090.1 hypothetical protein [Ramlibacter sp.]